MKNGWIHEDGGESYLTSRGVEAVESGFSDKVKKLIEAQHIFVGIFGRRDKLAKKAEWTTSPWVIDEKAYALGRSKRLVLLKEEGVTSIGGLQGDYEFIEFSRERLDKLVLAILEIFDVRVAGLRK